MLCLVLLDGVKFKELVYGLVIILSFEAGFYAFNLTVHRWLSSPWAFFGWKSAFFRCPQRRRCCRRRRRHHRRRYRRCCCCVLNRARRFKVHLALIKSALHFSPSFKRKKFPTKERKKEKISFLIENMCWPFFPLSLNATISWFDQKMI